LRLPANVNSCIRVQPKCFDERTYKVEDNVTYKDEKQILQTKTCPVASFIRWRYVPGAQTADKEQEILEKIGLESTKSENAPAKVVSKFQLIILG